MASVNKVILIGNLGKDPEVRHLEGGVAVARFPLATSETFKDKSGQKQEKTEWHNIVLWRGLAEVAEKYLRKGQSVFIEGKIRTSQYQDKEGNQRYSTEIVADNMTMLTRGEGGSSEGGNNFQGSASTSSAGSNYNAGATTAPAGVAQNDEPDDLPF
ncbi:single-stranded DNA-binding protein [Pontibacter sp. BT310]|jgi:single-strand DNA-binding protein|uniref:Single-stranded DNA-binding protein n=1 Tax=Pontibacter populi TaxID=890055 RepID=A0ABS6XHN1_9BACT|nr:MULTISPECIES: single-stranded DNA-binding protein [Pontibacter]MBJ6119857.1 single-stranded DNA-binding protein [Pontibacter sp. BT310]MBR0572286.1 single-stranded DNA-binding protein [Microvirga sp. STS03]MBW3366710.1 single-stranded DNA-binding protein [Pontibacter populi]